MGSAEEGVKQFLTRLQPGSMESGQSPVIKSLEIMCFQRYKAYPDTAEKAKSGSDPVKTVWPHLPNADFRETVVQKSGTKPKLWSPDIFWWGRGLPYEGVGAKKFGMPLETREIKLLAGYPGILLGYPGGARKVWEKKSLCSILVPYNLTSGSVLHPNPLTLGQKEKSLLRKPDSP